MESTGFVTAVSRAFTEKGEKKKELKLKEQAQTVSEDFAGISDKATEEKRSHGRFASRISHGTVSRLVLTGASLYAGLGEGNVLHQSDRAQS